MRRSFFDYLITKDESLFGEYLMFAKPYAEMATPAVELDGDVHHPVPNMPLFFDVYDIYYL